MGYVGGMWEWTIGRRRSREKYSATVIGAPTILATILKDNTISTNMRAEILRSNSLTVLVRVLEREGIHRYHSSNFHSGSATFLEQFFGSSLLDFFGIGKERLPMAELPKAMNASPTSEKCETHSDCEKSLRG